jgi:predicted RNase H-like HicB family nuclease
MPPVAIKVEMRLPASTKKVDSWYIASCPPLDVHSQGMSEHEALHNLTEALRFFIESCFERGTLEQVLKDSGFSLSHDEYPQPQPNHYVNVPISLLAAQHAQADTC